MNVRPHSFQQLVTVPDMARGARDHSLASEITNFADDVKDPSMREMMFDEIPHYERMAMEFVEALADLKRSR